MSQLALDVSGPNTIVGSAIFSPCGMYRYDLRRELGGDRPLVTIGINPSVANDVEDDRTIMKDIGFAKLWGCGRVIKGNANAYVAQKPAAMKRAAKSGVDIVGPDNDRYLRGMLQLVKSAGGILLVSWGNHIDPRRQIELAYLIDECEVAPMCLGKNKNGTPEHELYVPYARPLVSWDCP